MDYTEEDAEASKKLSVNIGTVRAFNAAGATLGGSKQLALKPIEETAETLEAWKLYRARPTDTTRGALIDEIADGIQALANLACSIGAGQEMAEAMLRCEQRNRQRDRIR